MWASLALIDYNVDPARARALVEDTFGHRSAVPAPGDSPPS